MSFLVWHYTKGLRSLFLIARNFLWFFFEFFSIGELSKTLFFPWHRDVSRKYWRGFDPVRWVWFVAENAVSRIIGAIVRFCVIVFGLFVFLLAGFVFALVLLLWNLLPLLLLVCIGGFLWGNEGYGLLGILLLFILVLSFVQYWEEKREKEETAHSDRFLKQSWFYRVLCRVGVDVPEKKIRSYDSFKDVSELFLKYRISRADFQRALSWEQELEINRQKRVKFWRMENLRKVRPIARQWQFGFTPHIDRYGFDLLSSKGLKDVRICAHPEELESMKITLSRSSQSSVLLVAPPGMGKRSLIQFLAKQIWERSSGIFSSGERLISIDLDRAVFSGNGSGYAQEIIEQIFSEAALAGNVILVIEDIDHYLEGGSEGLKNTGLLPALIKYLSFPGFRMIATTSGKGFHMVIEKNESILEYLEIIELNPIDETMALLVLLDAFDEVEQKRILFTLGAFRSCIRYSNRFYSSVSLPERALDMAKEVLVYWQQHPESSFITENIVDTFVSLKTGVPLGEIQTSEKEKLMHLEDILSHRIIGQPEAVRQIVHSLRRFRVGMSDSTRPIGSFLFLGPTGVGKTELAKTLSKVYFGKEGSLVRLDMSEFQSPNSVDRLIGSVTQNIPGQLTTLVRDTPYGVLLLDELEKSDKGVLDLFLQILDEGFFTDAFGQRVVFTNMIIIATSNAGGNIIERLFRQGNDLESVRREVIEYLIDKNIFRVEFLNRFDGVIFFRPIDVGNMVKICRILLEEFSESIQKTHGITLQFEEEVFEKIAKLGYDQKFGARGIKRFIADSLESKIAENVIRKNLSFGESIQVRAQDI